MRFLKVLFWLLLGGVVAAFVITNGGERVSIQLGGGLIADFSLPVLLILMFLAGFLPMLLAYHALKWRTRQRVSGLERALADELGLREVDQAAEADLERRVGLLGDHRVPGRRVVDVEQDQPGLEPDHVEGDHPRGADPEVRARVGQRVPHRDRVLRRDPHLVAEVAGVPRPGHVDRDP